MRFSRRTDWNLTTNAYTKALEEHRRAGRELLDLTASNPTTVGLHYRDQQLLAALSRPESLTYEPTAKGLLFAREAISTYYAERGVTVAPDNLILTTSTSEAYSFVFRLLCEPGDSVLVPTPSYPLFDFLADLQDVKLVPYELVYDHGWLIDFHSLRQTAFASHPADHGSTTAEPVPVARPKAVLVVHPNNPTGSFVKPHEAQELHRLCCGSQMAIIADEVFLDYSLGDAPFSFASTPNRPGEDPESQQPRPPTEQALTFTLSGLSKISGLPQMKVAWIAVSGPEALKRDAMCRLEVIADTYLSMNAPVQWAIPTMLEERRDIQPQLMTRIRSNLAELDRRLSAQQLCHRLQVEGGWYVVLRVPAIGRDEELAVELLRATGVLVQPGHFYDFANDGLVVISLITPEREFAEGIRSLLRFLTLRCG